MENTHLHKLSDEDMAQVNGGYLKVSEWRQYVTGIVVQITTQLATADDNDKQILNQVYGAIQGTMIPGAAISDSISNAKTNYYAYQRAAIHSDAVRSTLDSVLDQVSSYLDENS